MYYLFTSELKEKCFTKPEEVEKFNFFYKDNEEQKGFMNARLWTDATKEELIDIELDDYYAFFPDPEDFANRLSKVLKSGTIDLYFVNQDGSASDIGFRVSPNKVEYLFHVWVTQDDIDAMEGV